MTELVSAFLGGFAGGALGFAGNLWLEGHRRRKDVRGLASALAGEIATILYGTRVRQHVQFFTGVATQLRAGVDVPIPRITPPGADPLQPVVSKLVDKIGMLPGDLPELVVRFYSILGGIRLDIDRLSGDESKVTPVANCSS